MSSSDQVNGFPLPAFAPAETLRQFSLEGKKALVTGASRGLGQCFAAALCGAGAEVAIWGRQQETLDQVAGELQQQTGRRVLPMAVDVSDSAALEAAVPRVADEVGTIDILVNNAGINFRVPVLELTEEQWDEVIAVNLKGAFFLSRACGRLMTAQRSGKIINILSLTSFLGLPTVVPYTAAKGGMNQLTKLMAVEWAEYNVQVNAIAPGYFRTAMTQPVRDDQRNAWVLNRTPAGRWGEPVELCGALLYFASAASNFVTGQILYVDGGFTSGSDWRHGDHHARS